MYHLLPGRTCCEASRIVTLFVFGCHIELEWQCGFSGKLLECKQWWIILLLNAEREHVNFASSTNQICCNVENINCELFELRLELTEQ